MRKNFWLALIAFFSVWSNVLPVAAQTRGTSSVRETAAGSEPAFWAAKNPAEVFRAIYESGDPAFAGLLTKTADRETAKIMEAQAILFFERFEEATRRPLLAAVVEKAREFNKQEYEKTKARSGSKAAPNKPSNENLNGFNEIDENRFDKNSYSKIKFVNAEYSPLFFASEPEIKTVETDTSRTATASERKTIDTATASVTREATNEHKVSFDGNTVSTGMTVGEKTEAVSKTDGRKITRTSKLSMGASFEVCPDAEGVVRGTGKTTIFNQTTAIVGSQIAALTADYSVDFAITAYVNDDAEMTHFDMAGTVTEKMLGYDRARRIGMGEGTGGITDGTKTISYEITGNTPPTERTDQYGFKKSISPVLGKVSPTLSGINTDAEAERVTEVARHGLGGFMIDLELLMRSSISRWRNYDCVDVECTAPKTSLKPNEPVEVSAVSVSKLDSSKFNAKLKGVGSQTVAPENQEGAPAASYTVTAPAKDKASIYVTSTSKRGIGLGGLEIPVGETKKKPPVKKTPAPKKKDCDAGWAGTVKAVRVNRRDKKGNPSGRLVRQVEFVNETYSVNINVLGTRDLTGGIVTNFHGFAEAGYLRTEYRESNYAPGRMSCSGSGIITSPETKKFELQTKGEANGKVIVTISVIGNWGHISFTPPELQAERIGTSTYESNCPSYNAANSGTERGDHLIDVTQTGFEIEFDVDASSPDVIAGSKTVQETDGSETTYTWNLARCQ